MEDPRADQALKLCRQCKVEKSRDQFALSRAERDGLMPVCRACVAETAQHRQATYQVRWSVEDPQQVQTLKHCYGCGLDKPRTAFHRERGRSDGLRRRCKDCANRAARQRRAAAS